MIRFLFLLSEKIKKLRITSFFINIFVEFNTWKVSRSSDDELVCSGRSLAAKAFRWNSLDSDEILVRLPWCVLGNCINPFHFARDNRKNLEGSDLDSTPDSGSLETFDNCKSRRFEESFLTHVPLPLNDSAPDPTEERWAICMFWEGKNRIGRTFSVDRYRNYLLIFSSFNFSIILLLGDISQFLVAWWMKMDFVSVLYLTPELLAVFEIKVKS